MKVWTVYIDSGVRINAETEEEARRLGYERFREWLNDTPYHSSSPSPDLIVDLEWDDSTYGFIKAGNRVYVSGFADYGGTTYRVASNGTVIETADEFALVSVDQIDGDSNVNCTISKRHIFPIKED